MCASMPRGGRRPTYLENLVNLVPLDYQGLLDSRAPLGSEKSHFFKWLFTKMAVSVVCGWESGLELAGSSLMQMSAWICFRTSFSFEGNDPPLQIRSFGGNRGKCNRTRDDTEPLFSSVSMRQDLHVADSSYLPWNEAYDHSLSLSHLICFWCLAMKASPMSDTFSLIFSLKDDSARKNRVEFVACCLNTDCSSWFPMHHHLVLSFTSK